MCREGMKLFALFVLVTTLGCATTQPLVISDQQRKLFQDVIRNAEAAGAAEGPPLATQRLAEAKSEFEYSQHLPMYPDRARRLVTKAQADAETALKLAQSETQTRLLARETVRLEYLAGSAAP
jgi:hypothetical protein